MCEENRVAGGRAGFAKGHTLRFVQRVKARHGDKVDCSQTVFADMSTPVHVSCLIHGPYTTKPRTLLECGTGCMACAKKARLAPREQRMQMMLHSGKKQCSKCNNVKPHSEFAKTKDKASGLVSHCKACVRAKSKELWDKGLVRDGVYQRKYGISLGQYQSMFQAQNGACCICGTSNPKGHGSKNSRFSVDHCHRTGKVRGLLCHHCNIGIGAFGDDPAKLNKAIEYLFQAGTSPDGCTSRSHCQD